MKQFRFILLFICCLSLLSCSKRILEAVEVHKLHDEYFILRKNGFYSHKVNLMGMLRLPDTERGRYLLSRDSIYFVKKIRKNLFSYYGYAWIDTLQKKLILYPGDSVRAKEYTLILIPVLKSNN
jgi:hypothetical protein